VVSRIPHCAATIVPFDVRNRLEVLRAKQNAVTARPGPDGQAARLKTAGAGASGAPAADGQSGKTSAGTALADHPQGAVAAGAGEAGREDGPPAAPAPPPAALRGLLPGRRSRQRRGQTARGAADKAKDTYERPAPPPGVKPIGALQVPGRATVEGRVRAVEIRPVERSSVLAVEISDSTGDLTALFYGRSHIPGIICGSRVRFRGPLGMRDTGPIMINPAYELLAAGEPSPPGEDSG